MLSDEQASQSIITSAGTFIKIDENCQKYPCIECKKQCSGDWFVKNNGVKRPYPCCSACIKKRTKFLVVADILDIYQVSSALSSTSPIHTL